MVTKRQARTSIARLQSGLEFIGEVGSVRQTYYVFEAEGCFFVLSFARPEAKRAAGYFNIVDTAAVEFVRKKFAGEKSVTAKEVAAGARRTKHAPSTLIALNILYVLVARGEARIAGAGSHQQLLFSIARA